MWPRIGPIATYGTLYLLGIITHFIISHHFAKSLGLKRRVWIITSVCYLLGMIPGAKLLYDISYSNFDLIALFTPKHYLEGGLWGGLLVYFLLAVPLVMVFAKRKWAALDLVALTIPIPWILAKVGCLLNGCCYGLPCSLPWAITFPEASLEAPAGIDIHPTQLYEIIIMVMLLLVFKVLPRERWRGTMLLWFICFYGIGRAIIDIFRWDVDRYIYIVPFTLAQLVCIVTAILSIVMLLLFRQWGRNKEITDVPKNTGASH